MSEDYALDSALMMAAAFAVFGKKRKTQTDPEYTIQETARVAAREQAKFETDYMQAHADDAEFDRCPRAFKRRLSKIQESRS